MTTSLLAVSKAMESRLIEAKRSLGLQDVFFGDQRMIPRTPTVCVAPVFVNIEPTSTGFQSLDELRLWVYIYHGKIQDYEDNLEECLALAESVRTLVDSDKKNKDTVLFGYTERLELGASARNRTELMIVTRITWRGINKATY